jgi:hypothetical protein
MNGCTKKLHEEKKTVFGIFLSLTEKTCTEQKKCNFCRLFTVYFVLFRSATPFMTSVSKPLGRITLRDFKTVFDRPGFYRYHIKNTDTEYGMVKEEVRTVDHI